MSSINQYWTIYEITHIPVRYDAIPPRVQRFITIHLSWLQHVTNEDCTFDGVSIEQIVNFTYELVTRVCAEEPQCIDQAYDLIDSIYSDMTDELDCQPTSVLRPEVLRYVEYNAKV